MSYQMIHLDIANRVLPFINGIESKGNYYLGAVAPDTAHAREPYSIEYKIELHLFQNVGVWATTGDYSIWMQNIRDFWNKYNGGDYSEKERAMAAGICVHNLGDYYNSLIIWDPYRSMNWDEGQMPQNFIREFSEEQRLMDQWDYRNNPNTEEIFRYLSEGEELSLDGFLNPDYLVWIKNNLINNQYNNKEQLPLKYKYYDETALTFFLDYSAKEIIKFFKKLHNDNLL